MARYLRLQIKQQGRRATDLIGPVPCFYARLDGYYRWQIILRGPDPAKNAGWGPILERVAGGDQSAVAVVRE